MIAHQKERRMKNSNCIVLSILILFIFYSTSLAWKKEVHCVTLPFIEGLGLYSTIRVLQESKSSITRAPAMMSLSLLGANTALGSLIVFGPKTDSPLLYRIHRYIGFALCASSLWMSLSAGNDAHVSNTDRNMTHGYMILTTIPLITFLF